MYDLGLGIGKTIVLIVFCFVTCIYLYYKWATGYWKRRNVESVPAPFPFGSATKILQRKLTFGQVIKDAYATYKARGLRYVGFYLSAKPMLIVLDINLIKTILTKDFHHFTDHGGYVNEEHEPLTGHLFALTGQRWKNLRMKLAPTFTSGKMKMMFHTLVDCTNGLRDVMDGFVEKEEPVNIKDVVSRYTTDVIGSCAFGLDCNSLKDPNSEFIKFGKKIFTISRYEQFVRFLAVSAPRVVNFLGLHFINKGTSDFIMDVVKDTIDYREKNNVLRKDFMHLLIQLKNNVQLKEDHDFEHLKNEESFLPKQDGLTINQVAAQAFIFFIAGFETSSTTLTFCFYELVTNPDIQYKLRNEINTVLKKHNGNVTYEGLMEMHYMDKCIQETLRKYPPLPFLFRECTETYAVPDSDLVIEKGTRLFIPSIGIHYDTEFYLEPEKFDPERFNTENAAERNHYAWLPFGEGPRICLGLRFGLMQTKVALVALLRHYEFTLSSKTQVPLMFSEKELITTVKGGVWLNVKKL